MRTCLEVYNEYQKKGIIKIAKFGTCSLCKTRIKDKKVMFFESVFFDGGGAYHNSSFCGKCKIASELRLLNVWPEEKILKCANLVHNLTKEVL